jgi:hypothetical protein
MVFAIRLLGVALVFIFSPILAIVLNILIDYLDGPVYKHYLKVASKKAQYYDKFWDYAYYIALLILIVNIKPMAWQLLVALFFYRSIGELAFFVTGNKKVFIYFPNFFEYITLGVFIASSTKISIFSQAVMFSGIVSFRIWNEIFLHRDNKTFFAVFWLPLFRHLGFRFAKRIKL